MSIRLIAYGIIATTFFIGLKPFNFISKNDVRIDSENEAIVFNDSIVNGESILEGIAYTVDELDFGSTNELSILLEIKSHSVPTGLGMILTFLDDHEQPPLIVAQWQDHIAMRSRRINKYPEKQYIETGIKDCFKENDFFTVLLSSSSNGMDVFINGSLVNTHSWFQLKDPDGPFGGRLILGNDAFATQSWQGSLKRVALYNKAIKPLDLEDAATSRIAEYSGFSTNEKGIIATSSFGPELSVPTEYEPVKRDLLSRIEKSKIQNTGSHRDMVINIFGFMPIGFAIAFLSIGREKRFGLKSSVLTLAGIFMASLLIEWLQSYLPSRDSSQLDLLCNTLGGAITVVIATPILYRLTKGF